MPLYTSRPASACGAISHIHDGGWSAFDGELWDDVWEGPENRAMSEHPRHDRPRSPAILHLAWGIMEVPGLETGKDVKLWPGGGRAWDWRETDTQHVPGIQIADLAELIDHGAETLVLSRGMDLLLQTGVRYHILETRAAARLYNVMADAGSAVGGLFHSTC
jgi:uncharacterized protein